MVRVDFRTMLGGIGLSCAALLCACGGGESHDDAGPGGVGPDGAAPGDAAPADAAHGDAAHGDAAHGDAAPPDAGAALPFAPHQLAVSQSALAAALSNPVSCTIFGYVGGTHYMGSGDCHTQGIAATSQGIVTSCQDTTAELGLLERMDGSPADHGMSGSDTASWTLFQSYDPTTPRTHVVVGQGLEPLAGTDLIPSVSSNSQSVPAEVALLDIDQRRCSFIHNPGSGDLHLGASSLTLIDDTIYLAACSWNCDRFFVYRLDSIEGGCAPTVEASFDVATNSNIRVDGGAGDANWGTYNSLALVLAEGGQVILLAGHDGWLDTWELSGFPGPAITFRKIAKANWGLNQAHNGLRGMFFEGMSVDTPSDTQLRIWTAPHDYGLIGCGTGRSCMRAVYLCPIAL